MKKTFQVWMTLPNGGEMLILQFVSKPSRKVWEWFNKARGCSIYHHERFRIRSCDFILDTTKQCIPNVRSLYNRTFKTGVARSL